MQNTKNFENAIAFDGVFGRWHLGCLWSVKCDRALLSMNEQRKRFLASSRGEAIN